MADKTKYFDYDTVKEMLYDLEYEGKEVEPSDYPYIEIADEHGALKDFNDIVKIFDGVIHDVDDETNRLLADLLVQIQFAPTIVEGELNGHTN